jgi:hypothetical protein
VRPDTLTLGRRAALALLAVLCLAADRSPGQDVADGESSPVPRLFERNEPLDLRLTADFDAIGKDRDSTKRQDHPGVLSYLGPTGDTISLDVQLRTRAHFRLRICKYPPLKVRFDRDQTAQTVFRRQKSLKLTVQCRDGQRYTNYLLEEFLLYRVYNLLTDLSKRARLVSVTYVNSHKPEDTPETRYAFFLEDDDRVAHRNHGEVLVQGVNQGEADRAQMGLVAVFEYMIGNTDWSVPYLHNILLVQDSTGTIYPVPYDFDWSGVIAPPYARPDARLGITSVRQRLYRSGCRSAEEFAPIFTRFLANKDTIYALYRAQPGLEEKAVKQTLDYYDDFYKVITDSRATRREMMPLCQGR